MFVHEDIAKEFIEQFVSQASRMRIGDPLDEDTTVGATISPEQAAKVTS